MKIGYPNVKTRISKDNEGTEEEQTVVEIISKGLNNWLYEAGIIKWREDYKIEDKKNKTLIVIRQPRRGEI